MLEVESAPPTARPPVRAIAALSACTALLVAAGLPAPAEARKGKSRLDPTEKRVIREVNRLRARSGLAAYTSSRALARSADFHSSDMLRGNFFAHASSNGTSMEGRVRRYTRAARIGENLAWMPGGPRISVRTVVSMWMGSPPHRAALLAPDFAKIGIARRTGLIGRTKVTVFTADLATRR